MKRIKCRKQEKSILSRDSIQYILYSSNFLFIYLFLTVDADFPFVNMWEGF